jgi:hypothetical protein
VVAADRGDPPLWAEVDVELDVVDRNNKPPLWDLTNYGPIFVKENVTVGTVVTSVKARSVFHVSISPFSLSIPSAISPLSLNLSIPPLVCRAL